jgi:hypothetical protein
MTGRKWVRDVRRLVESLAIPGLKSETWGTRLKKSKDALDGLARE